MSCEAGSVEVIARGVFSAGGRVLLCRNRRGIWFLPGGHVEPDEGARAALARELMEELGIRVLVGAFLGAIEYGFVQEGRPRSEINLVFRGRVPGLDPRSDPPSREPHLRFAWKTPEELAGIGLMPPPLQARVPAWMRGAGAPRAWISNRETAPAP